MVHLSLVSTKTKQTQKTRFESDSDCITVSCTRKFGWWVVSRSVEFVYLIERFCTPHFDRAVSPD